MLYWTVGKFKGWSKHCSYFFSYYTNKVLNLLLLQVQWQGKGQQLLQLLQHLLVPLQGAKLLLLALFDEFSSFGCENHDLLLMVWVCCTGMQIILATCLFRSLIFSKNIWILNCLHPDPYSILSKNNNAMWRRISASFGMLSAPDQIYGFWFVNQGEQRAAFP